MRPCFGGRSGTILCVMIWDGKGGQGSHMTRREAQLREKRWKDGGEKRNRRANTTERRVRTKGSL